MKKILIYLGIIVIIAILGFFYYKNSPININIPSSFSQGDKMLPSDFATLNYSSNQIRLAEEKINEVEIKLNEARAKDLSRYDFLHRQFLENMIDRMDDLLNKYKENLNKAKEAFENKDYYDASSYASIANTANIMLRHINNILEGRTKGEWNRMASTETGTKSCLDTGGDWKQFLTSGEFCHDECNKPEGIDCSDTPSWSCDCGEEKCWDGAYCVGE